MPRALQTLGFAGFAIAGLVRQAEMMQQEGQQCIGSPTNTTNMVHIQLLHRLHGLLQADTCVESLEHRTTGHAWVVGSDILRPTAIGSLGLCNSLAAAARGISVPMIPLARHSSRGSGDTSFLVAGFCQKLPHPTVWLCLLNLDACELNPRHLPPQQSLSGGAHREETWINCRPFHLSCYSPPAPSASIPPRLER